MLEEQQAHRQPVQAMHRMLSKPVNYAAEAAGVRYLANRQLRGLAQWQWQRQQKQQQQQREKQQQKQQHQPRVHPDRARTFCLPEGWTSDGIWTADLVRIHSAVVPPPSHLRKSTTETTVESQAGTRFARREKSTATVAKAAATSLITRFGDEPRPLPPPPPLLLLQSPPPPQPPLPQQPPQQALRLSPRGTTETAITTGSSATSLDWVTIDPEYFAIEQSAASAVARSGSAAAASPAVSAKRLQASGGALAHIGRNGRPARSAPALAAGEMSPESVPQRTPNLCWKSEVADPAATIILAAQPGAWEAAKAADVAAALEAQRRSRQVVVYDHVASAAREAAVLERLRFRSAGVGQQQQQPQPGRLTAPADNAAIADAVDGLRRANTSARLTDKDKEEATKVAKPEAGEDKAAVQTVPPPPQGKASRTTTRRAPPPTKKPLVTRPFAAATFSPRYEADAGLVISTVTANSTAPAAAAISVATKRATPNRSGLLSASPLRQYNTAAPSPNGDYLSIVSPVPGQHLRLLQQQFEQQAQKLLQKQQQQQQQQQQLLLQRQGQEQHQRQQQLRQLQASAPMPSTPRGDEAPTLAGEADLNVEAEAEAVEASESGEEPFGLAIAAAAMLKSASFVSTVSLTSTKDSELARSAGAVRIPTEQRKAAATDAEKELEEWLRQVDAGEDQDDEENI